MRARRRGDCWSRQILRSGTDAGKHQDGKRLAPMPTAAWLVMGSVPSALTPPAPLSLPPSLPDGREGRLLGDTAKAYPSEVVTVRRGLKSRTNAYADGGRTPRSSQTAGSNAASVLSGWRAYASAVTRSSASQTAFKIASRTNSSQRRDRAGAIRSKRSASSSSISTRSDFIG